MLAQFAAVQSLVIGVLLAWSSYGKLHGPDVASHARRTALSKLVGDRYAEPAYRTVGGLELAIAVALLLPPVWKVDAIAATALAAGFVGYVVYARIVVPESSCGCMGSAATPVRWRTIARAGLLLATALVALTADTGWWSVGPLVVGLAVVEAMLFVALSAELDRYWLMPLRRLRVRLMHPLAGTASYDVPLAATHQQLLRSTAYQSANAFLRSDIRDHWDEGDWRFVSYTASYGERSATAVFAVPRLRYEPTEVRVAIVDDSTGETLYRPATPLVLVD
jgi:hypothetical protein